MGRFFYLALDWSEVWALLIPLGVLMFRRKQPETMKPVIIYLFLALFVNLLIDLMLPVKSYLPEWLRTNNPFYNIHSIIRFFCFSIYFIRLPNASFLAIKKILIILSIVFLFINFAFFEKFFNFDSFSGNLLAAEAYVLLIFCLFYYLSELREDENNLFDSPHFWVVTGLSIYVVVNFFVFLFYMPMIKVDVPLAINIWNVHNVAFIIFCLFISKAFYGTTRYQFAN